MCNDNEITEQNRRPEFIAAFLRQITARGGWPFLLGNWGMVKIIILRMSRESRSGRPVWEMRMALGDMWDDTQDPDPECPSDLAFEFTVAFLHELKAKDGGFYLIGRLGLGTVTVLETSKRSENDLPVWVTRLSGEPAIDVAKALADEEPQSPFMPTGLIFGAQAPLQILSS